MTAALRVLLFRSMPDATAFLPWLATRLGLAQRASPALLLMAAQSHEHGHFMHLLLHFGLVGFFLVTIVDSSFVPLPIPGISDIMIVFFAAQHVNLILLVGLATAGSALGGYLSFLIGQRGGMQFLEHHVPPRILKRVTGWMENHAVLSVALPAILPPPAPLAPFVLAAGALNMSVRRFMLAFTGSRLVRHAIAAFLGVHYGKQVLALWAHFSDKWATTILITLWSVILIFVGIGIWRLYVVSKTLKSGGSGTGAAPLPNPSAS